MIDKSSLLKSQGRLYLEFILKDGLFHKMLLLLLMGFLTGVTIKDVHRNSSMIQICITSDISHPKDRICSQEKLH